MALAMIEAAEADGRLSPSGVVVEYTGGSTGVSLALVCAVKGYPLRIVTSDAFAAEKLDAHAAARRAARYDARATAARMTGKLTRDMIEAARVIAAAPGSFWTDQLNNTGPDACLSRARERDHGRQTGSRIDAFVQSVGTAASLRGHGRGAAAS